MIARNETGQLTEAAFSIALLTEKANECHRKVGRECRSGLMYAKKCGDVLISLRKKFPVHGKMWRQHIEEYFEASYKTAKVYMRIARKWHDSRLAGTRRHGLVLKNIKQILSISKCGPTPDNGHGQDECTSAPIQQDIREGFAKALQQLSSYELDLFATEFNYYWVEIRKMLYRDTCTVLGQDLGEVLSAEMQNMKDRSRLGRWEVVKGPSEEERQEKESLRLGMEEQQENEPLHLRMFEPEHEEPTVRERPNEARNRKKKRAIRLAWQEAAVDVGKRKRALEAAKQRKRKAKPRERLRAGDAKTRRKKRTKRTSVPEKARTKSTGRKTVTKKKKTASKRKVAG